MSANVGSESGGHGFPQEYVMSLRKGDNLGASADVGSESGGV